jgi:hypothetical protein
MRNRHNGFPSVRVVLAIFFACVFSSQAFAQGMPTDHPKATLSNAAAIPGRLSSDQMNATLAAADEESRQAFSNLVQQTAALPATLLSIQEATRHRNWPPNSNPSLCIQKIFSFQGRLGKSLQPKQVEDIVAMNQLLSRRDGSETNWCRGVFQSNINSDLFALFTSVSTAIDVDKQCQERVESAKKSIIEAEGALDSGDLNRATQLYQRLDADSQLPHFAQSYLQQTQSLRQDLAAYSQAVEIARRQSVLLSQQLQNLSREVSLLNECASSRPLTQAYLQHAIKDGIDASRRQLANLPTFQFNEASYQIPTAISENDKLALIARHIKTIDEDLAKTSEARAIIAQPEAMKTLGEVVGGTEAANLKATADQIAAAERVRKSLLDAQSSLQAKIAAVNNAREEAERQHLAAVEAKNKAETRKQATDDALTFINSRFVASNCTRTVGAEQLCSRNMALSVVNGKLTMDEDFDDHHSNGSVEKSHFTDTVAIADLNVNSMSVVENVEDTDTIFIDCKKGSKCTSATQNSGNGSPQRFSHDRLTVSYFPRKDIKEIEGNLKRFLEAQQGKTLSAIEHDPTEGEALAFLQAHFAPSLATDDGITAIHRRLTIVNDDLIVSQDGVKYGMQPERLVVTVNLKDLDDLDVLPLAGDGFTGVSLACKVSSDEKEKNCFLGSTGQSSPRLILMGVSNRVQFARMLKRLIVLHESESRASN